MEKETTYGGSCLGTLGVILAVIISWTLNHSIGWAIFHGFLGWFYVIYRWILTIT